LNKDQDSIEVDSGKGHLPCLTLLPVSAGFGVAERNEAQATSGRAKVGRGCEAQRSEAIPNRTDSGFEF